MLQVNAVSNESSRPMDATMVEMDRDEQANAAQFLTFVCDGEEYGIDILRVQEIKGWDGATRVPQAPAHVLGVMNLRGVIVPVVDLRTRFGLARREFDASTVVIVVRVQGAKSERTAGIVVDAVSEVYSFSQDSIKPPPGVGGRIDSACINGLAMEGEKMVMLLDIDRLISTSIEAI